MVDPRQFYLQWAIGGGGNPMAAGNPYMPGGLRPPGPLPAPYLHSLAQFHNLKALATKTFLEQQNLAKTILQQSSVSSQQHATVTQRESYIYIFSDAKVTLQSPMSVHPSVCPQNPQTI